MKRNYSRLKSMLMDNGFTTTNYSKQKIIVAYNPKYPRLFFQQMNEHSFRVFNIWELNGYAKRNNIEVLKFINRLNTATIMTKFYLEEKNILTAETFIPDIGNEPELLKVLEIIRHDMITAMEKEPATIKFFATQTKKTQK